MKAKKLISITLVLVTVSALLLTGSLALLANVSEGESPIPQESALPEVSDESVADDVIALPDDEETPVVNEENQVVSKEEDGKTVVSFLSEEELNLLAERRSNGEWLSLTAEEMAAMVQETVDLFYTCHRMEVGVLENDVYTVKSYDGYLYYTSDEYEKKDFWTAPDVDKDVFEVILARITAYHDALATRGDMWNENWEKVPAYYYAFLDMPRMDSNIMAHASYFEGHVVVDPYNYQEETYNYVVLDAATHTVTLCTHTGTTCERDEYARRLCMTETPLFYDETFKNAFVDSELVENSYKVTIEIYRESTQELVASIDITDSQEAEAIYDTYIACMEKACDEYYTYGSAPDFAYRSEYRVVAHMTYIHENEVMSDERGRSIAYPYGYTNEIFGQVWDGDVWKFMDYHVPFGKPLVDLLDTYVTPYIPAE